MSILFFVFLAALFGGVVVANLDDGTDVDFFLGSLAIVTAFQGIALAVGAL